MEDTKFATKQHYIQQFLLQLIVTKTWILQQVLIVRNKILCSCEYKIDTIDCLYFTAPFLHERVLYRMGNRLAKLWQSLSTLMKREQRCRSWAASKAWSVLTMYAVVLGFSFPTPNPHWENLIKGAGSPNHALPQQHASCRTDQNNVRSAGASANSNTQKN